MYHFKSAFRKWNPVFRLVRNEELAIIQICGRMLGDCLGRKYVIV